MENVKTNLRQEKSLPAAYRPTSPPKYPEQDPRKTDP